MSSILVAGSFTLLLVLSLAMVARIFAAEGHRIALALTGQGVKPKSVASALSAVADRALPRAETRILRVSHRRMDSMQKAA